MIEDYHDEIIKRMADLMEQSFARQEAIRAELENETKTFNARIDIKLNRIKATVNDIKHDMTRQKIIMTIIIVAVQIISALLVHYLK